jgi:large subunit ribosomal protein L4
LSETKTLFVVSDTNENVYLSGRNLPKATIVSADELSTYSLVNAQKVLISESALVKIESLLK